MNGNENRGGSPAAQSGGESVAEHPGGDDGTAAVRCYTGRVTVLLAFALAAVIALLAYVSIIWGAAAPTAIAAVARDEDDDDRADEP